MLGLRPCVCDVAWITDRDYHPSPPPAELEEADNTGDVRMETSIECDYLFKVGTREHPHEARSLVQPQEALSGDKFRHYGYARTDGCSL